jgi:hypothetical protein
MATASASPNDLLVSDVQVTTRNVVYLAGAVYPRGTVLGEVTVSRKVRTSATASNDGSEVPTLVAAFDVDATAGDVTGAAYSGGAFDSRKLIYGTGHTAATVEAAFRKSAAPLFVRELA